jgi:hypothetical protein
MAIIYTYPSAGSVAATDSFIVTDSSNKTKTITAQGIADYIDGTVTLQETLNTGNTAYYGTGGAGGEGDIKLGDIIGGVNTTTITLSGQTGDITTETAAGGGHLVVGGDIKPAANIVNSTGAMSITTTNNSLEIMADTTLTGGKALIIQNYSGSVDLTSNSGNIKTFTGSGTNQVLSTTGAVTVSAAGNSLTLNAGTNASLTATSAALISAGTSLQLQAAAGEWTTSSGDFNFAGGLKLSSVIKDSAGNTSGGVANKVLLSTASNLVQWRNLSDSLTLPTNNIFVGSVSNTPTSSSLITVNSASNLLTIGSAAPTTTTVLGKLSIPSTPPSTATSAGVAGEIIAGTDDYIYICTATNTWVRVQASTF